MTLRTLAALTAAIAIPALAADPAWGPAVGTVAPAFTLPDQNGQPHSLQSLIGDGGAIVVFYRSADW